MHNLFSYGTLQVPEVLQHVIGKTFTGEPAVLPGYAIYCVKSAEYPGILSSPDDATHGTLYSDINEKDLATLDRFEGSLYERRRLNVSLMKGDTKAAAWVYVTREEHLHQLSRIPWLLDNFLANEKDRFMKRFVQDRRDEYISDR